ncbi:MAG: hypothetical protein KDB32_06590 [Planctomycetes bacterium]|nr:hypothetical protein [Planctomycetota bacterium]
MKSFAWVLAMGFLAVAGLSTPLAAQCSGGSCPNSGASTGGSCPNGGKSVGQVPIPKRAGGVAQRPAVDPEAVPSWQRVGTDSVESAAAEERPIVVYFPGEDATECEFSGKELAELSNTEAVFVKIAFTEDREASPWAEESAVPTSKLLSDNPSREYDIPVGKSCVLVCDWFGNEYYRTDVRVDASKLSSMIRKVKDQSDKAGEKLQKNLDKAKDYLDKQDRKNAVKYLLKNFGEGVVGLAPQEESIRMYHEILDAARLELATMVDNKDADGIKNLAKDLKKTDIENEIDDALESVKS